MEGGIEKLEGGYRVKNISQTQRYLYLIQFLMMVVIIIYLIVSSGTASLKPLYIPINTFIYFILVFGLIFAAESMVFRVLLMRFSKNRSSRYYMAKRAQKRAIIILLVTGLLGVALFLPIVPDAAEDLMTSTSDVVNSTSLTNKDVLGLTAVTELRFEPGVGDPRVYVVEDRYYQLYKNDMERLSLYRINGVDEVGDGLTVPISSDGYHTYHVVIDGEAGDSVSMTTVRAMSPTFLNFFPFMMFLYTAMYAAWLLYLIPIKKSYSEGAIYA